MSPTSTSPPALKHIPLSCDSDESGISALHIVLALFPNWELEDGKVEFVRFTEGITNTVCAFYLAHTGSPCPMP